MRAVGIIFATILLLIALVGSQFHRVGGLEFLMAIYILYLVYEVMEFHRAVSAFRPFVIALTVYLALKVISANVPYLALYLAPVEPLLLPFLFSLALIKFEFPFRYQPIITTAGLILSALFGYQLISLLPIKRSEDVGIVFLIVMALLALTTIIPVIHSKLEFLRKIRSFLVTVTLIVSVYYIFVRPILTPGLKNFADWLIVAGIFFKSSSILRRSMVVDEREVVRVHEFKETLRRDEIVESAEKAKRLFVERGIKSPLIAVISHVLITSGWKLDEVAKVISFIVSHEDDRIPKLSFGWERRMIERRNRKRREKVIKELEKYLEGIRVGS